MKVAILSTYNQECGIAEYSSQLRKGLEDNGHEVIILANYPYEKITQDDNGNVFRCFDVEIRTGKTEWEYDFALAALQAKKCDILIVQYEASLYARLPFHNFLELVIDRMADIRILGIFHSSCIWPDLKWNLFDFSFAHDEGILNCIPVKEQYKKVIRQGVVNYPDRNPSDCRKELGIPDRYTIGSIGLGRTRYEIAGKALNESGKDWQYFITSPERETVRIQELRKELSVEANDKLIHHTGFFPMDELALRIQACDKILIDYPPTQAKVTSASARTAIGCRRQILISQTNWFSDLLETGFTRNFAHSTEVSLLGGILDLWCGLDYKISQEQEDYIQENCWKNIVKEKYVPVFNWIRDRK